MNTQIDYHALRHVARCAAFDVVFFLGEALCLATSAMLLRQGFDTAGSIDYNAALAYILWTCRVVRLIIWALFMLALSQLITIHPGFARARIWLALRVLTFTVLNMINAFIDTIADQTLSIVTDYPLEPLTLIYWMLAILLSVPLPCMTNGNILQAGARLLDFYGLSARATRNRLSASRFLVVSAALVCALSCRLACAFLEQTNLLATTVGDSSRPSAFGIFVILITVFVAISGVAYLVLWAASAVRMRYTYQALEELTR